jgi:hypothetical protein
LSPARDFVVLGSPRENQGFPLWRSPPQMYIWGDRCTPFLKENYYLSLPLAPPPKKKAVILPSLVIQPLSYFTKF